ncbi:FG-GAP repeat domain-containing protein [Membranihabitans marinus]|uniref:FG-GAP repeat domain-containing protein n=1 Tax=Membranihabitans marinus TaxID=1227546 RepID=UPI001F22D154|nr:VCBS repeat-containing protein [Membranihabitans marinus]
MIQNYTSLVIGLSMCFALFSCAGNKPKSVKGEEVGFVKQQLTDEFVGEGAAVADVNKDGQLDVLTGAFWFEAPDWKQHRLANAERFVAGEGYSNAFLSFSDDIDGDGWEDVIRVGWPGKEVVWYSNSKNQTGLWTESYIYPHFGNENPLYVDIDGDGVLDLLGNDPSLKQIIWLKLDKDNPTAQWQKTVISEEEGIPGVHQYTHGLGYGDVDGDGHKDVVIAEGWWQNPGNPSQVNWTFHRESISDKCAQMYIQDLNGDGLVDILCSSAHDYGVWWLEQSVNESGERSWIRHNIDTSFSQSHSLMLADINRDGHQDLITGKRYFAHNGKDPGGHEAAVLYWYEYHPGPTPRWTRHQIDNDSGAGLNFVVRDINGDHKLDVVTSNKKGVNVFLQQ